MRNSQQLLVALFIFSFLSGRSQDKSPAKFGNVTEKDFANKVYSIDSNANAVVIADIGTSEIEGNSKGWFSLVFKHYERVHILNKNGYNLANVTIPLYTSGNAEEQLDKVKAVTYNLENGKVVESKLDTKENLFKDKLSKNWVEKKFTFPNVREGSIIEYEYTVTSDFLSNLQPWEFQGGVPRMWSEYNVSLPEFLGYVFLTQGSSVYDINDKKSSNYPFHVRDDGGAGRSQTYDFNSGVTDYHWVMKNVPALKEESYTSTINNHISKIEFQLSEYRYPLTYQNLMGSWQKLADDMLKDEDFGDQLKRNNDWLDDITGPLVKGVTDKVEKARKIFAFVRDNYTCTSDGGLWLHQNMKNLVKTRNGNVAEINLLLTAMLRHENINADPVILSIAEINLLLTAMLRHENINADPVILSTRSHGYTMPLYPLLTKFNYVISRASIDGNDYYLDATEPRLGFGRLPLRCYNGHARVINAMADPITLSPDSVMERKFTTIFIINGEKGDLVGSLQQTPGYYESTDIRDKIKDKGKDQLIKDIQKAFGSEIEIHNPVIDSLDRYDDPLTIKYDFDLKAEKGEIIYINPMFGEGYKENPFKSAVRSYPVEMPDVTDEFYNLQFEVPTGYVLDELPKPIVVKLNEQGDGVFEYRISESGGNISLRSRIFFKRSYFAPDEYEMLREFFNLIVNKQSEQIVFKKKK